MERQIGLVVGGRWSLDALGECLPNTRLPTLHWPNPPFTENEIRGVGGREDEHYHDQTTHIIFLFTWLLYFLPCHCLSSPLGLSWGHASPMTRPPSFICPAQPCHEHGMCHSKLYSGTTGKPPQGQQGNQPKHNRETTPGTTGKPPPKTQIGLVVGGKWPLDALEACIPMTRPPTLHWSGLPFHDKLTHQFKASPPLP